MAKIFKDTNGNKHDLDTLSKDFKVTVELDEDIVTGEVAGYGVLLDDERNMDVNEDTYNALKKILG